MKWRYLVFQVNGYKLGIPLENVVEVLREFPEIVPVPNTPSHVKGVINLRGNICAVVDVGKRYGFEGKTPEKDPRIVIVETEKFEVGMWVDKVDGVFWLEIASEDTPDPGLSAVLLKGEEKIFELNLKRL